MMISSGKMTQARLNSVNCLSNAGSFNHHRLSIRGRPPVRSARSLTLGEGTRRGFLSSFRTRSASAHEELVKVSGHNGITTVSPEILEDHHLSYEEKLRLSSSAPNLGVHLANRLVEIGCTTAFGVPGDFNLLLLDQLLLHPELNVAWCCNELNAGYAADGYARKKGVGCAVVTFCVGGFSILNAVAGAYSEDLPVIVISGVPNTNDYSSNRILHHTIGLPDFNQQLQAFKAVTCHQVTINHIEDAHKLIDEAITVALQKSKPVYIEVSCNLASQSHPSFTRPPVPFILPPPHTNPHSVDAAVEAASKVLNSSVKPVLLAGPRIRSGPEREAFIKLADSSEYAVAILPDAKGMVPEDLATFIGLYWGAVSWPCVCEIVESADLVVTVGCVWTDYATVGYSLLLKPEKTISVSERRVVIRNGMTFGCITGADFMNQLADSVKPNPTAYTNFERMYAPPQPPARLPPNAPLTTAVMFKHIQEMLTSQTDIISEVGDSWFNSQKLNLPPGCGYEMQMRYGSIGWSVGATLGYTTATKANITDICNVPPVFDSFTKKARVTENRRVISLIGDGSFQMTAQDVSTMLRYDLNPIIFLLNNASYTIEVQIHDGPYNAIMNWNYTALIESMNGGNGGKLFTAKVTKEEELEAAIAKALSPEHEKSLCFIEVVLHRDDCSKELLEWGARVATANGRPPQYH